MSADTDDSANLTGWRLDDGASSIEDYAMIGDCRSAALVSKQGSIDWLCWPRFDSGACFAALLGTTRHGRWRVAPVGRVQRGIRHYRAATMVLESVFETEDGIIAVIDYMPMGGDFPSLVRVIEGRGGDVLVRSQLLLRFDYGASTPWLSPHADGHGCDAIAGPNCVAFRASVPIRCRDGSIDERFVVSQGDSVCLSLTWRPSHLSAESGSNCDCSPAATEAHWREWSDKCTYRGAWHGPVLRSLLTLKALTYQPTGGIVAAPTSSLPEEFGGVRNWDYRYCWLRDATLTLTVLLGCGYREEAECWRVWLQRAVAGDPAQLQILYGIAGERCLPEWIPNWLPGYRGSAPVRIGNAASDQLQIDVFGEIVGAMHLANREMASRPREQWEMGVRFIEHLARIWEQPDESIWEVRGGRQQFVYSKVMAWVALDRAIEAATIDESGFYFPEVLPRWRALRERMHEDVCARGFNSSHGTFTQTYESEEVDASLLAIPLAGFLPIDDPRVIGTIEAIEQKLLCDGFVMRYRTDRTNDGLAGGEGVFLPCSFWLVEIYALQGRRSEAEALFVRLVALCNDVGLLSEEYSPSLGKMLGNFPQAFSHLSLVSAALRLESCKRSNTE